jgi:hypothetical protein
MSPKPGTQVQVRNAFDEEVSMVAVTAPQAGVDFPVVWVCTREEYDRARSAGEEPDAIPWPLSAVKIPEPA